MGPSSVGCREVGEERKGMEPKGEVEEVRRARDNEQGEHRMDSLELVPSSLPSK